jgi:predicted enzyme related to lactoylglutathione lyase
MGRTLTLAIALALHVAVAFASPLGPDGTAGRSLPGKFIWYDLATEDTAASRAFYGAVFGWKFREVAGAPASYTLIENGNAKIGGLFKQARPQGAKVGSRWLSLMSVASAERPRRS